MGNTRRGETGGEGGRSKAGKQEQGKGQNGSKCPRCLGEVDTLYCALSPLRQRSWLGPQAAVAGRLATPVSIHSPVLPLRMTDKGGGGSKLPMPSSLAPSSHWPRGMEFRFSRERGAPAQGSGGGGGGGRGSGSLGPTDALTQRPSQSRSPGHRLEHSGKARVPELPGSRPHGAERTTLPGT